MKDFKDKVAVITGAASGIGFGIAKRAVKEGMKVVIADIEANALANAKEKLDSLGANVLSIVTDVSKLEDVQSLAEKTIDSHRKVHLLFNNAGVAKRDVLWDFTLEDWKWINNVNYWGVVHGLITFLPIFRRQNLESRIISTASIAGLTTYTLNGIYGPIKNSNLGTSDRNRPIGLKNREPELDRKSRIVKFLTDYPEFKSIVTQFGKSGVERAIFPEKVGDIVFEAIKDDAFYILTDTGQDWVELIKSRMNRIIEAFERNKLYRQ
ncbi:MAG: SDR family NAD(P)-dependent oxidoreductase [Promethearchaeota archaeon]|jgi:hypothetical protein